MKGRNHTELPHWVERFIHNLCGDYWAEGVQGDLQENFKERTSRLGQRKAKLWLYLELIGLLRFVFYRKKGHTRTQILCSGIILKLR